MHMHKVVHYAVNNHVTRPQCIIPFIPQHCIVGRISKLIISEIIFSVKSRKALQFYELQGFNTWCPGRDSNSHTISGTTTSK